MAQETGISDRRSIAMKKSLFCAIAACMMIFPFPQAFASIGTGIGITFPMSGSGGNRVPTESYASFSFDRVIQELTVKEKRGKLFMELKITNDSDEPYSISHRDGQFYEFAVLDKNGKPLYRWSDGMAFPQALTDAVYPAHESVIYTAELDRKTYREIKDDAVLATAFLTDTPYRLSARIPMAKGGSTPVLLHGAIVIGNGTWYDD